MTGSELITAAYQQWLDIGQTVANSSVLRARIRTHGQQGINRLWRRPFPWRCAEGTVLVDTAGFGPLPSNFATFGGIGLVGIKAQRYRMMWLPQQELFRMRLVEGGSESRPRYYTVGDQTDEGVKNLWVHRSPSTDVTVDIFYQKLPPTLVDDNDPPSGLEEIPSSMHEDIVLGYTIAYLMEDEGDTRSVQKFEQVDALLFQALADEQQDHHYRQRRPRYGMRQHAAWGYSR